MIRTFNLTINEVISSLKENNIIIDLTGLLVDSYNNLYYTENDKENFIEFFQNVAENNYSIPISIFATEYKNGSILTYRNRFIIMLSDLYEEILEKIGKESIKKRLKINTFQITFHVGSEEEIKKLYKTNKFINLL